MLRGWMATSEASEPGLLALPSGLRALVDVLAGVIALACALAGWGIGALLGWPLSGLEILNGWTVPFIFIAGGARALWALYMLAMAAWMYVICLIASD
jgi:hypothetical protein